MRRGLELHLNPASCWCRCPSCAPTPPLLQVLGPTEFQSLALTSPVDPALRAFAFYVQSSQYPIPVRGFVSEWNRTGQALMGPILFSSPIFNLNVSPDIYQQYRVQLPTPLALDSTKYYVLFFSSYALENAGLCGKAFFAVSYQEPGFATTSGTGAQNPISSPWKERTGMALATSTVFVDA